MSAPTPFQDSASGFHRPRGLSHTTSTVELEHAITRPGTVKINVSGAYIVEDDASPSSELSSVDGDASPTLQGPGHDTNDIRLPHHTAVVSHVAVDIGGSLIKLVHFSRSPESRELGGRLTFLKFETHNLSECISFISSLKSEHQRLNGSSSPAELCVMATGGGAFKYYDRIQKELGVEVIREDEMECLIIGLDFFISEIPGEVFTYSEQDPMHFVQPRADIYPYLLVNIGSGVSMIKVLGPRKYERIGGTSLGGGTLWGLLSLLTGARSFDEMLAMADKGDNTSVDMLVGDIYGTDYGKIGLKSTTIASSFGKVYRMKREAEMAAEDDGGLANGDHHAHVGADGMSGAQADAHVFRSEDVSRSLLYAVSNNIGQLAYLHAEKHKLEHIYFGGSFIRGHRQTMNTLSYAVRFWSKGEKQAYFLRHEGYLGAVGAFLKRQPKNWGRRNSTELDSSILRRLAGNTQQEHGHGPAEQ